MILPSRDTNNPLTKPNRANAWEAKGAFNGSILHEDNTYTLVYRALADTSTYFDKRLQLSTIGCATSTDNRAFSQNRQLIVPEEPWEKFGCEDPRITKIDNEYFVFYTALSDYPFHADAIKVGLAVFSSLDNKPEKHLVTPFNAKAMVLFPQKIQNKYVALITVNTDVPPASIALAIFEKKEDMWSHEYWNRWYRDLEKHTIPLQRMNSDQLEVGSVPIATEYGWLVFYSHIQHYYMPEHRLFGIEAIMLDKTDPQKIIARTTTPVLTPQALYEKQGNVADVVFPTGGLLENDTVSLYYGASDTYTCRVTYSAKDLFDNLYTNAPVVMKAEKYAHNPILTPLYAHDWESKAVFNPAAYFDGHVVHLLYRAMSSDNTSVFGHAISADGFTVIERGEMPIYVPRAPFETKRRAGILSGCEDPRITRIGDQLYVCYTAFDGINPPRVALSSISIEDFTRNDFNWKDPILISPPGIDDKDAALFPEKINGKFVIIHRIQNSIVIDFVDNLNFGGNTWLRSLSYITPRGDSWDSEKIGLSTPPIKSELGWVLFYHGVSRRSHEYRVGVMLLALDDPSNVLIRTPWPILEPETHFERSGFVNNVVFPCGAVEVKENIFIYYGGADTVVCAAIINKKALLDYLTEVKDKKCLGQRLSE